MAFFYLTKDEDIVLYVNDYETRYGHYDIIPAEYYNGQLITPPIPIGRDPKCFCKKVTVHSGCLHTSPIKSISVVEFSKPIELNDLLKKWRNKLPRFKQTVSINKKKIGDNLYF